ncbi:hypothetical protein [Burkholderia sp. MSMB1072]|uniref:hypothetical protein n=1 Tax=Burkholderia sp. MSMB1072 TaxID=1637871 RepID=UPI0012E3D66A|nr:hypothetical protein [Burkholderia sp. MSMB1072]
MKKITKFVASAVLGCCLAGAVHAAPLTTGYWQATFYQISTGAIYTSQGVCIQPNNTWYSTTQHAWSGDWFQNGTQVQWYGNVVMSASQQLATVGIGQLTTATTVSGDYAEWSVIGAAPLSWDRHYTHIMVYQGATCPPPA